MIFIDRKHKHKENPSITGALRKENYEFEKMKISMFI